MEEVESVLSNKWVLIGGASVLAIAAYFYLNSGTPASAGDPSNQLTPVGSFAPVGTTAAGYVSSGMSGATSNSGSDPSAYLEALANLQSHSDDLNSNIALATIDAQRTIALTQSANDYSLGVKAVDAQNAMTASTLFSSLFKNVGKKNVTAAFGQFGIDPLTGSITVYGGNIYGGNKQGLNNSLQSGYDQNGQPIASIGGGSSIMLGGSFRSGPVMIPANTGTSTGNYTAPASSGSGGRSIGGAAT